MNDLNSGLRNFPLAVNQQVLFSDVLKNLDSTIYDYSFAYENKGHLDVSLLEKILSSAISRRSALHTSFAENDGIPYQIIHQDPKKMISIIDAQSFSERDFDKIFEQKTCIHFNIFTYPLYDFTIIKRNEDHYYFISSFHHLIMDAGCLESLFAEISAAYNDFQKFFSETKYEKILGIQDWLDCEKRIDKETFSKDTLFWNNYLKGAEDHYLLGSVPSEGLSQPVLSPKLTFHLSPAFSQEIRIFAKKTMSSTLFRVLLATYYVLLSKYTEQNDITLSYPMNLRTRPLKSLFGYCVGVQPLRVQLEENLSFQTNLDQISELIDQCKGMIPYVYTYKEQKLDYSNIGFGYSNFLTSSLCMKDLDIISINLHKLNSHMDLLFLYDDTSESIEFRVEYNASRYEKSFIENLFTHYQDLLKSIIKHPEKPISALSLLTKEVSHRILVEWNATGKDYPKDKTLHSLFEDQVEKTPYNIAVVFEEQQLTYKELNDRANQLAHFLREKGVKPDTLVAIACDRSPDLVIGILAILKAGGSYVPLDPSYPAERLFYMMEDTKAPVLLTQSHLIDQLPKTEADVVLLDNMSLFKDYPASNLICTTQPHHLAYVIYTSGSTGKPKGVMIEHKSICDRLFWYQDYSPLSHKDKFLHQLSFSFDAAVMALWWPDGRHPKFPVDVALNSLFLRGNIEV